MTTTAIRETTKLALALTAYGIELRLWKERGEREWGATLTEGNTILHSNFGEDNLALAKLHVLGEARSRAMIREAGAELPGCDTFFDVWKPVRITHS